MVSLFCFVSNFCDCTVFIFCMRSMLVSLGYNLFYYCMGPYNPFNLVNFLNLWMFPSFNKEYNFEECYFYCVLDRFSIDDNILSNDNFWYNHLLFPLFSWYGFSFEGKTTFIYFMQKNHFESILQIWPSLPLQNR